MCVCGTIYSWYIEMQLNGCVWVGLVMVYVGVCYLHVKMAEILCDRRSHSWVANILPSALFVG